MSVEGCFFIGGVHSIIDIQYFTFMEEVKNPLEMEVINSGC
jgi:hypothetical protein